MLFRAQIKLRFSLNCVLCPGLEEEAEEEEAEREPVQIADLDWELLQEQNKQTPPRF